MKKPFGKKYQRGGGSWGNKGGSSFKKMHRATCGECHAPCQVPFKPVNGKVVLCSHCFGKQNAGNKPSFDRKPFERKRFDKPSFRSAAPAGNGDMVKELKKLNEKMDKLIGLMADMVVVEEEDEMMFGKDELEA